MAEDGKIVYKVSLDDSNVESEAQAAGQKAGDGVERGASRGASGFQEIMIGAARRIGEAFIDMAAKGVQAVEQIAKAGIEFNAKMEKYQTGLTTLLGSEQEAVAAMEQIRRDAASTPFDVDSLTQANQMLISTGMSAGEARSDVLNLANAIAATGGGSAELSRMAANMQQVKNVGKATAMDIRQFAMAGINIYGLLADATGKTTEEVKDMEVSYELLSYALEKAASAGGAYEGAMEAQSQTFNGRISTLKDNATMLAGTLTEDLFGMLSETALPKAMEWVQLLLTGAEQGGIEGALAMARVILENLVNDFLEGLPQMLDTGLTLLEELLHGIANAIPKINNIILKVIMALITALINHLPEIILAGMDILVALVNGIVDALPQLIAMIPTLVTTLVTGLLNHLPELITAGMEILFAIIKGIVQSLPQLIIMADQVVQGLWNVFKNTDWLSIGQNIVSGIWEGIKSLWNSLVESLSQAMSDLWQSVKNFFGISSPSKKFKWIGEMNVEGMIEGFEEGEQDLTQTVHRVYDGMLGAVGDDTGISSRNSIEQAVSYSITASGKAGDNMIVIPVTLDGREIARATAWMMGEQLAFEEI